MGVCRSGNGSHLVRPPQPFPSIRCHQSLRHGSNELDTSMLVSGKHCQAELSSFEPSLTQKCSIKVCERPLDAWLPTAQASFARASTPANELWDVPVLGVDTTLQLVPSHCSINAWKVETVPASPTAQI